MMACRHRLPRGISANSPGESLSITQGTYKGESEGGTHGELRTWSRRPAHVENLSNSGYSADSPGESLPIPHGTYGLRKSGTAQTDPYSTNVTTTAALASLACHVQAVVRLTAVPGLTARIGQVIKDPAIRLLTRSVAKRASSGPPAVSNHTIHVATEPQRGLQPSLRKPGTAIRGNSGLVPGRCPRPRRNEPAGRGRCG